jgi:hypothetical protein
LVGENALKPVELTFEFAQFGLLRPELAFSLDLRWLTLLHLSRPHVQLPLELRDHLFAVLDRFVRTLVFDPLHLNDREGLLLLRLLAFCASLVKALLGFVDESRLHLKAIHRLLRIDGQAI